MLDEIKIKLEKLNKIWDNYILNYKVCYEKINYSKEVESNYTADILAYLVDTLDIVFLKKNCNDFSENFSNSISFLQAIYIQQDLVEELLNIFFVNFNNKMFKNNDDCKINRELRNELVGHPVSKKK